MPNAVPDGLGHIVEQQDGVVSRSQLLRAGLTRSQTDQRVRGGWWQRIHPGVYATFTGPVTDRARMTAALLALGPGAAAALETALWLAGYVTTAPEVLQICVPHGLKRTAVPGTYVVQRKGLESVVQPGSAPARIRLEVSILDVAHHALAPQPVITLILAVVQRRFTTVARLRAELARRRRHRWRRLLNELLEEAGRGVASGLERRYYRDVEKAHGLPVGLRNRPQETSLGRCYYDVYYREWNTIAELDGRIAHPSHEAFRDWRRDNAAAVAGDLTLRYGWVDVVSNPCAVAKQVDEVLRRRGWPGHLTPCPNCAEARSE